VFKSIFEARLPVGGNKYLKLAVSGCDWSPNGYYKYHWLWCLVGISSLVKILGALNGLVDIWLHLQALQTCTHVYGLYAVVRAVRFK
jgi:hypothetical protein